MNDTNVDPDLAERLGVAYADDFAKSPTWTQWKGEEPDADLQAFFDALPGDRMLDVGCGWARYVYRFLDQGLQYIGIDHSPEMVRLAQDAYPDQQFELMSYRKLEFPEASFDGLWCCCTFSGEPKHNMPTVLAGLKRILVTGGVMMVVMPAVYESHEELEKHPDGTPHLHHAHYDLDELAAMLEQSGFTVLATTHHWADGAMSVLVQK